MSVVFPRWADAEQGPKVGSSIEALDELSPALKAAFDRIKDPILDPTGG